MPGPMSYLQGQRRIPRGAIFVLGRSIGSGPATTLAAGSAVAGLILESPFTSIKDAASALWFTRLAPVDLILKSNFDNRSRIGLVRAPILIISGTADTLTPPRMARELYQRAQSQKAIYFIDGAGHDDLVELGSAALSNRIRTFLDTKQ